MQAIEHRCYIRTAKSHLNLIKFASNAMCRSRVMHEQTVCRLFLVSHDLQHRCCKAPCGDTSAPDLCRKDHVQPHCAQCIKMLEQSATRQIEARASHAAQMLLAGMQEQLIIFAPCTMGQWAWHSA